MPKKILLGVAAALILVIVFIVVAATRPSAYHVERKLEVAAPPDVVFAVVNDLNQLARVIVMFGSPLESASTQKKVEGGASGVGQTYAWSGGEAGTGAITIEESVPAQKTRMKLELVEPMASTSTIALVLAPTPKGTVVTWSMDGHHNVLGRAMGMVVDVDGMLGDDIDKSLARLQGALAK